MTFLVWTFCAKTFDPPVNREKHARGVLLLHDNIPVHKSNITLAAIQYADLTELNRRSYSPDLAPRDYYLFSNLKNFLRGRNFETDDEAIMTVNHCLESLASNSFFFLKA